MGQQLNLKLKGLYTSANELSANPEGALSVADNVVIDFDSLAQSRRGFDILLAPFNDGSARASQYTNFQDQIVAHNGPDTISHYTGGVWVDYAGAYPAPDAALAKTKFLNANKNLYFTSSMGVFKLDTVGGTPVTAGMAPGLDIAGDIDGSGSGFFPTNSQVAYRMLWGIKDANGNLVLGAPSGRAVIVNTSGNPQNTTLTFTIPDGITTAHFYQLYRSATTNSSTTEPNDELQLVYEANPTAGEITAGEITVTDITPDSLKGATLYTSPSQDGILQANTPPVYCQDMCEYKGFTFYANVKSKQRLFLTIVSVGGTQGIQIGDTLTIGSTTYTAAAAENIAANEFELFTLGTPAQNIADTAASLIRVINRSTSNTQYYGYYVSGYNALPGQMLFEERSVNGASYAATASANGTAYSPNLPVTGTDVESTDDVNKNGIFYSKFQQPEAVPLVNKLFAGNANNDIRRIVPLRDSIIVLKTDGIFQITGSSPDSFQVTPLDLTARIFAPESAVILSNEVWMLSDQGVVSVSDTGTQVRSRPIEDQLIVLFGTALQKTKELSFGVAYETDRKYILFTVQNDGDVNPSQAFVFNTFTNTWTRWLRAQTAGFVNPTDNKLYLGSALNAETNQERKSYTYLDFVDESIGSFTVLAEDHAAATLQLNSVVGIQVGDLVKQSPTIFSTVVSIDLVTNTLTLSSQTTFLVTTVEVFQAIDCILEWNPATDGNPGVVKQWQEIVAMFKLTRFYQAIFGFRTELSQSVEEVAVGGTPQGGWGLFGWGTVPWGGSLQPKALRTYVTQNKQYASQFTFSLEIRSGYSDWKLQGISIPYESISVEITK